MARKTRAQVDAREERIFNLIETCIVQFSALAQTLLKAALYGFLVYQIGSTIRSFAGQNTVTDVDLKILAQITLRESISYSVAASSVGYGYWQRRLRKKSIERLQKHIQILESEIDSGRTSSQITSMGFTNPQDKD